MEPYKEKIDLGVCFLMNNDRIYLLTGAAYKAIEEGVVGAYKAVEKGAVDAYRKVEDTMVDKLFRKDGESIEEAKERLRR